MSERHLAAIREAIVKALPPGTRLVNIIEETPKQGFSLHRPPAAAANGGPVTLALSAKGLTVDRIVAGTPVGHRRIMSADVGDRFGLTTTLVMETPRVRVDEMLPPLRTGQDPRRHIEDAVLATRRKTPKKEDNE